MPDSIDDDLFEGTKMTFGEHLEELRGSLLKAVVALVVGFLIGLLIGPWVVRWIQTPVVTALEKYYGDRALDNYLDDLKERGLAVPADAAELEALRVSMHSEQMIPDSAYINPVDILAKLREKHPGVFDQIELPTAAPGEAPKRENMIQVFLWKPTGAYTPATLRALNAQEAFMIYIKASLMTGVVVASPFVFFYVWQFVAAGLYPHERKYVHLFMPISIALFLGGAAMAFFVVFQYVLDFLLSFNAWLNIDPELRISEWMSFVLLLPIGFGVSFQLPLVMLFLERIGVASVGLYVEKWRIAVLVIAIISMILTPADPMSMMLMDVPLTVLYFAGIAMCKFMPRGRSPFADALD